MIFIFYFLKKTGKVLQKSNEKSEVFSVLPDKSISNLVDELETINQFKITVLFKLFLKILINFFFRI